MPGEHILELLYLDTNDTRLSIGNKWMVVYGFGKKKRFTVYQHKRYQRQSSILIDTELEEEACKIMKEN